MMLCAMVKVVSKIHILAPVLLFLNIIYWVSPYTLKFLCFFSNCLLLFGFKVSHVIRCRVHNATNESVAVGVGKSVVNSPLLKCAVNGNDPNVGSECVVCCLLKKIE